ncbi:MAG: Ig-like domain repeat protein [Halobacteriota archaeon]
MTSQGITVCGGSVTVLMNGKSVGQVTSGGASGCFKTAYFTLSGGLPKGTYTLTLNYSGDSTYQSSTSPATITVS